MKQMWKKDDPNHLGESWYSHKDQEGLWCNGKPKKEYSPNLTLLGTAVAQLQASNARIESQLAKIVDMLGSLGGRTAPEPVKSDKPLPF